MDIGVRATQHAVAEEMLASSVVTRMSHSRVTQEQLPRTIALKRILSIILLFMLSAANADTNQYVGNLHDGHIHYDDDVWDALPPDQAIEYLSEQNITRALVSATPTWGAEKLSSDPMSTQNPSKT